jgi:hypothetical protein
MLLRSPRRAAWALPLAVLATACADPGPVAPTVLRPSAISFGVQPTNPVPFTTPRKAEGELFELCKDYPSGTGPSVTFDVSVTGGTTTSFQVTLGAGQCQEVWLTSDNDVVTVTEQVPAGYAASYVKSVWDAGTTTTDASVSGNTTSGGARPGLGTLVVFTNTPLPPPPGPSCTLTHGYWKNHTSLWDDVSDGKGFTTSSVFSVRTGTSTYLDVISDPSKKGNINIILGRQYIAALLNGATGSDAVVGGAISGAAAYFAGGAATDTQLGAWATLLDNWNNGLVGPGHCAD